jgi:hypothetical protein
MINNKLIKNNKVRSDLNNTINLQLSDSSYRQTFVKKCC